MKSTAKWQLTLKLIVLAGFAWPGQSATAGSSAGSLSFTIHVRNDAGVDSKTLKEAEEVASGIFQKTGVVSHWVDAPATSQGVHEASVEPHRSGCLKFE
jgi:hypothetical protein